MNQTIPAALLVALLTLGSLAGRATGASRAVADAGKIAPGIGRPAQASGQGAPPATPNVERVKPLADDPLKDAPGVLFHEDLERIADLKESFQDVGRSGGRFRITATDPFSGRKSIQQTYIPKSDMKGDPGSAGWCWRFFGDNPKSSTTRGGKSHTVAVARWYHKFEEGFSKDVPPKHARMRSFTSGKWHGAYTVLFWNGGEDDHISIERHTRAPGVHREWQPNHAAQFKFSDRWNIGRWIHFELRVALGEGKRSDRIQAWADGVLLCDIAGDDLAAGYRKFTLNGMSWDCYWNGGSPRKQSRFYDDLMLATEPVGPARTPLKPVIVKAIFQDPDAGDAQKAWQVEVAQGRQKPLVPARTVDGVVTRFRPPEMEYTGVWKGTIAGETNEVAVEARSGQFRGPREREKTLAANTLHFVRVRQQDQAGNWSGWSPWHAGFATTWAEGTPKNERTTPRGYLLGGDH